MSRWQRLVALAKRWWAAGVVVLLLLLAVMQNADLPALPFFPDRTFLRVHRDGVLRVGTDASYPPLAIVSDDGVFSGLDVELAQALADELGVGLQIVNIHWDGLFDALHAGKVDVVISAVPYDGTLTRDLSYSAPYADLGLVLVAPADGLTAGLVVAESDAPVSGLDLAGLNAAVELGSEGHLYAQRLARDTGWPKLVIVNSAAEMGQALATGAADVALCDRITGGELAADPRWRVVLPPLASEPVHVVTEKSASRLTAELNAALATLQASGKLEAINERWLGGVE